MTIELEPVKLFPLGHLRKARPCNEQYALVQREWPNGIPLNTNTVARILELQLDVAWAAENLLTDDERAEYERVRAPAWAEYERVAREPAVNRGDLVEAIYAWAWTAFPALCAADRGYIAGVLVDLYVDGVGWGQA